METITEKLTSTMVITACLLAINDATTVAEILQILNEYKDQLTVEQYAEVLNFKMFK